MFKTSLTALLVSFSVITALAGCSSISGAAPGAKTDAVSAQSNAPIRVVASTNVYGDIAKQIGGDRVSVTSIISDPSQDPHSYEADAQVQLSLSRANVVVQNGGGYDDFVSTLLKGANNSNAVLVNAATVSGYDQKPMTGEFNEHLWYDFPSMEKLTKKLQSTFSGLDKASSATFASNAEKFSASLAVLQRDEASIKSTFAGSGVAITEPVPLYMLEAAGLSNKTPVKFSKAIEQGTDVSPVVLQETLALFSNHTVKLLAYNEQTSGPETEQVLRAAKSAGVAIVPVTETLPAGTNYLSWMTANLVAIKTALS